MTLKKTILKTGGKLTKILPKEIDELSYFDVVKAIRKKDVKINGERVGKDVFAPAGSVVEIYINKKENENSEGFEVLFSDENLIVADKKSGFSSEWVFEKIKEKYPDARFVHRLDRNTFGVMVFARGDTAEKELLFGFKNRTFEKTYVAEVVGVPRKNAEIIEGYLQKDAENSLVKIYDSKGTGRVKIKTGYEVMSVNGATSTLKITLYTGKTHQIRAHLSSIGLPILGDGKYGDYSANKSAGAKTQMLLSAEMVLRFDKASPLYYLDGKTFRSKSLKIEKGNYLFA